MNFYKKLATGFLSLGALASLGFSKINDQKLAKWVDQAIQKDIAEYQVYGDYQPNNIEIYFRNIGVSFEDMSEAYSKLSPVLVSDVYSFEKTLSDLKEIEEIEKTIKKIGDELNKRIVLSYFRYTSPLSSYKYFYSDLKIDTIPNDQKMKWLSTLDTHLSGVEDKIKAIEKFMKVGFYEFVKEVEANEKKYGDISPWLNRKIASYFAAIEGNIKNIDEDKQFFENFKKDTENIIDYFREQKEYVNNLLTLEKLMNQNPPFIKKYENIIKEYDTIIETLKSIVSKNEKTILSFENLKKSVPNNVKYYVEKYNNKADELAKKISIPDANFLQETEQQKARILKGEIIRDNLDNKTLINNLIGCRVGYTMNKILPSIYLNFNPIESHGIYAEIKANIGEYPLLFISSKVGLGRMSKSDIIIYKSTGEEYLRIKPLTGDISDILNYVRGEMGGAIVFGNPEIRLYGGIAVDRYSWPTEGRDSFSFINNLANLELKVYEFSFRFNFDYKSAEFPYLNVNSIYAYRDQVENIELIGKYINNLFSYSLFGGIFTRKYSYLDENSGINPAINNILFGNSLVDISKVGSGIILGGEYYLDNLVVVGKVSVGVVVDDKRNKTFDIRELYFKAASENFYIVSEFDLNSNQIKFVDLGWKF